jgi:hypothetical protein
MSGTARSRFLRTELVLVATIALAACDHLPPANGTFDVVDHVEVTVPDDAIVYDHNVNDRLYHLPGGSEMSIEVADGDGCKPADSPSSHTRCLGSKRLTISLLLDHSDDRDQKIVSRVALSLKAY